MTAPNCTHHQMVAVRAKAGVRTRCAVGSLSAFFGIRHEALKFRRKLHSPSSPSHSYKRRRGQSDSCAAYQPNQTYVVVKSSRCASLHLHHHQTASRGLTLAHGTGGLTRFDPEMRLIWQNQAHFRVAFCGITPCPSLRMRLTCDSPRPRTLPPTEAHLRVFHQNLPPPLPPPPLSGKP